MAELLKCWRNGAFGLITGGVVGIASGTLEAATTLTQASKTGPLQSALKISVAKSVASRAVGCGSIFALYQTTRCGLRGSQQTHGLSEGVQIASAAALALVPAYTIRGVFSTSLLLIAMDSARYIMPRQSNDE